MTQLPDRSSEEWQRYAAACLAATYTHKDGGSDLPPESAARYAATVADHLWRERRERDANDGAPESNSHRSALRTLGTALYDILPPKERRATTPEEHAEDLVTELRDFVRALRAERDDWARRALPTPLTPEAEREVRGWVARMIADQTEGYGYARDLLGLVEYGAKQLRYRTEERDRVILRLTRLLRSCVPVPSLETGSGTICAEIRAIIHDQPGYTK